MWAVRMLAFFNLMRPTLDTKSQQHSLQSVQQTTIIVLYSGTHVLSFFSGCVGLTDRPSKVGRGGNPPPRRYPIRTSVLCKDAYIYG